MSETDVYLDARAIFQNTDQEVKAFSETLAKVSEALRHRPRLFSFSGLMPAPPAEATMMRNFLMIDAKDWKSATDIQEMMGRWHDARQAMLVAWEKLPSERRHGLQSPPETR